MDYEFGHRSQYFHEHPIGWLKQLMGSEGLALASTEPNLSIPPGHLAEVDTRFGHLPRPWLVLGLGASHPDKDWPDEHWQALLLGLRQSSSASLLVIGGPSWHARAERIIAAAGVDAVNACELPIIHAAALCQRADMFVGADSGALNLAAAVGTEGYGLFGMTPDLQYSRHIHVVRATEDPRHLTPMREILPDRVLSVVAAKLALAPS